MARALKGHGPSDDPQWNDDRTVVVVTVGDTDTAIAGTMETQAGDHRRIFEDATASDLVCLDISW
jgi:hypothetical protein